MIKGHESLIFVHKRANFRYKRKKGITKVAVAQASNLKKTYLFKPL